MAKKGQERGYKSYADAYRQAVNAIGIDAKPEETNAWLKENLDVEIPGQMIYNYRSTERRRRNLANSDSTDDWDGSIVPSASEDAIAFMKTVKEYRNKIGDKSIREIVEIVCS